MSTETQESAQVAEREITIYATRGGTMKKILSTATTWGELKPQIRKEGFDVNSLLAAENITRHDLISDLAVLPTGPFRVIMRPKETKSGAGLPYKEVRGLIQALVANSDAAKAHFNEGKNYTTKSTDELNRLYDTYSGDKGATAPAPVIEKPKVEKASKAEKAVEEKPKANVANVVESVAQAKEKTTGTTDLDKAKDALAVVSEITAVAARSTKEDAIFYLGVLIESLEVPVVAEETEEARRKAEAEEEEKKAIEVEAREMARGY